jgi:hypothetical protein
MYKRLYEIEERIKRLKEVAKEFTNYELQRVIGVGNNEIYFVLEGYYQEFLPDRVIQVTIRETQHEQKENFYLFKEEGYLKIEQVVKHDDVKYLVIFEMTKFEN